MKYKEIRYECDHCGHTAKDKFTDDVCPDCGKTYWKCSKCGYTVAAVIPPDPCPECKEKCDFLNVTCYTPDCGGPGKIDPRLG